MVLLVSQEVILDHLVLLILMVVVLLLDILVPLDSHLTMVHLDHLVWDLVLRWCHCHRDRAVVWDHRVELRDLLVLHLRDPSQPRKRRDWQIKYCHKK